MKESLVEIEKRAESPVDGLHAHPGIVKSSRGVRHDTRMDPEDSESSSGSREEIIEAGAESGQPEDTSSGSHVSHNSNKLVCFAMMLDEATDGSANSRMKPEEKAARKPLERDKSPETVEPLYVNVSVVRATPSESNKGIRAGIDKVDVGVVTLSRGRDRK